MTVSTDVISFRHRWRYRVDSFLAKGSGALFVSLVCAFVGSIVLIAVLRFFFNFVVPDSEHDFARQVWVIFLQLTDPGNMNQDNEAPVTMKAAAVVAGLTGVVIFSALIAFLTTALDQAIGHLKKGHSQVLESGQTLILGWGPRVIEILRELVEANESEEDPVVVILSDADKEEMDEYLRTNFTDRRNTRVVTRSGPVASVQALKRVSAREARSAIVLASVNASASLDAKLDSDATVIKSVLALESIMDGKPLNVVAEVFTDRNRQVVKDISPGNISVIDAEEILAKIMVQTSRTSGLSVVYSELLSFEGCEMYLHNDPRWVGLKFDRLQFHFPDGVPIGLRRPNGPVIIRPDIETALAEDDEILIVAEDDSTIEFRPEPVMIPKVYEPSGKRIEQRVERQLILGWSYKAPIIIREYSDYVLGGSEIDVMVKEPPPSLRQTIESLDAEVGGVRVKLVAKDPLVCDELQAMDPFGYNNVIILPQKPHLDADPERIDSETIVVLLHLRKLLKAAAAAGRVVETKLITEVLESSNRELVSHAGVNDFIISNRMVSMLFAQISKEPEIETVYDNLFEEEGSEIYVKPAWLYFEELPITCRFGDMMRAAQKRDAEICIGYKLKRLEQNADRNYGVELIPPKNEEVTLERDDCLVVVAEDDR